MLFFHQKAFETSLYFCFKVAQAVFGPQDHHLNILMEIAHYVLRETDNIPLSIAASILRGIHLNYAPYSGFVTEPDGNWDGLVMGMLVLAVANKHVWVFIFVDHYNIIL